MLAEFKRQVLNSNAEKNAIFRIWKEDYKKQKALRRPEETKNTIRLSDHFAGNQKNPCHNNYRMYETKHLGNTEMLSSL